MEAARPGAMVQHCLPAYRGQEITEKVFEAHADEILKRQKPPSRTGGRYGHADERQAVTAVPIR